MKYQHLVPQEEPHEIKVSEITWSDKKGGRICGTCGQRVAQFADNEGPESLKALLRLK